MLERLSTRVIAIIVAVIAAVLIVGFTVRSCDKRHAQAAQSRVERSQADAASNSAADAIGTVAASGAQEAASEDLTRSNEQEIRNAEGSNAAVNPAARDAGLRSLCRRPAYRDDQRCKLLKPAP
jgi:FtsZ-interacting cell division protein ZipA